MSHLFDTGLQSLVVGTDLGDVRLKLAWGVRCRAQTFVLERESGILGIETSRFLIEI